MYVQLETLILKTIAAWYQLFIVASPCLQDLPSLASFEFLTSRRQLYNDCVSLNIIYVTVDDNKNIL